MARPAELPAKRVWREEKECERLRKSEFEAMRCLLGALSYTITAGKDLDSRLTEIPYGKQRMRMLIGGMKSIADDLIGAVPVNQCKQIQNTMMDMEMRMVPKRTPMSQNVILEKDIAKGVVDAAMERCKGCVEDAESGRKCSLYKVLEGFLPLEDYSNGMLCPYSISEWED